MKTEYRRKEEEQQQVVQALEEEKRGLASHCAALRADLEEKQRQVDSQRDERDAAQSRLKDLEEKLRIAWLELSQSQEYSNGLAAQLSSKESEEATKQEQLDRLRHEFAEVQTLYRQSTEHAAEQSHLIKQLEGLNLDTQREAVRVEAAHAQARAQEEQHCGEIMAVEARLATSQKEITKLHHQLLKLRQELGIVKAARDFHRNRAAGPARASGIANGISGKVKFKTTRHRGLLRQRSHRTVSSNQAISWQGRSPSPAKDEWEDMSIDSFSSEEYPDSLNGEPSGTAPHRQHASRKSYRCSLHANTEEPAAGSKKANPLSALAEQLSSSKQLTQKLTSDLAGVEQQKKVLEMELEQWKKITFPPQSAPTSVLVNTECSCQGRTESAPANPAPQALETEVKQLQAKLKSASAEVTKQMAANKSLRGQLQEREDKLCQLQDKMSHAERDISRKRQLVEDFKTRVKFLQEMEKSYRDQIEELEKKVKTLSEEATNRKALVESLKRRLNITATEKSQSEALCSKLKEDLERKEQRNHSLQARVGASEQALAALEQTATEQMEGLTQQSSLALDRLQRQLGLAYSQLEQLHSFIKTLASEILLDVQEVKQQLMSRRRSRQASSMAAKTGLSVKSMIKAKSIAASILNMSENDLTDIMETDQTTVACMESLRDKEWLDHLNLMLQQKIPSAGQLMEAVRVKMKERKVLTEELAALAAPVSEKA
uniref:Centlein, centrosomal protein n=2 Tax=Nothobranchius TaxID=28779 RepID=A0A1A8IXN4_NOTKU